MPLPEKKSKVQIDTTLESDFTPALGISKVFPHLWKEGCYTLPLATLAVPPGGLVVFGM